jgi:hypothetical protein
VVSTAAAAAPPDNDGVGEGSPLGTPGSDEAGSPSQAPLALVPACTALHRSTRALVTRLHAAQAAHSATATAVASLSQALAAAQGRVGALEAQARDAAAALETVGAEAAQREAALSQVCVCVCCVHARLPACFGDGSAQLSALGELMALWSVVVHKPWYGAPHRTCVRMCV